MSRKLILLNLLLIGLLTAAGWQVRKHWLQARARERAAAAQKVAQIPPPEVPPPPPAQPVQAATYIDVAQNMLFSKDRNPNVIIEAEPPKPVPAFPAAHGVMDLGGGPTAILSEKAGGPQKSYRQGDKVGPFQIASLTTENIVLEWDGQKFDKKIAELKPKPSAEPPKERTPGAAGVTVPERKGPVHVPTAVEVIREAQRPKDGGPGVETGGPVRMCAPGENSPAGTVMGGYRKVITASPFGNQCRWEPIGR
jgi:hypothetical protein